MDNFGSSFPSSKPTSELFFISQQTTPVSVATENTPLSPPLPEEKKDNKNNTNDGYATKMKTLQFVIPFCILFIATITSIWIITAKRNGTSEKIKSQPKNVVVRPSSLKEINDGGCIFSLRYDPDNKINENLKIQSKAELEAIKKRLDTGEKPESILGEIFGGVYSKEDQKILNEYYQTRKIPTSGLPQPKKTYSEFNVGNTMNFCFQNKEERDARLNDFFLDANPDFLRALAALKSGETANPQMIYQKIDDSKKVDYAYLLVYKK